MSTVGDILKIVKMCEDKYPMVGHPDKEAAYKNGWYDASYYIRNKIEHLVGRKCKTKKCRRSVQLPAVYCSIECACYDGKFSVTKKSKK